MSWNHSEKGQTAEEEVPMTVHAGITSDTNSSEDSAFTQHYNAPSITACDTVHYLMMWLSCDVQRGGNAVWN